MMVAAMSDIDTIMIWEESRNMTYFCGVLANRINNRENTEDIILEIDRLSKKISRRTTDYLMKQQESRNANA